MENSVKRELIELWEYGAIQQKMLKETANNIKSSVPLDKQYEVAQALKIGNDIICNILDELKKIIENA